MLDSLNEEQIKPAMDTDGAILVTAGAGSGKTRLLTERISYLIKECGVDPYNILAITFTNKATNEMRERILKFCPSADSLWISTFHSMCARILRENISALDGFNRFFTIYDTTDKDKLLKKIVSDLGFESDRVKDFACEIDKAKNLGFDPDEYYQITEFKSDAMDTKKVYSAYQNELKNNNALDFDDLLVKTLELFKHCPNILRRYQERFRYIHIDEFQDTNLVQYKIAKCLAGYHKNIFVVGDEDQCIYGWRGANIENIMNFRQDFDNVKCYKLERNYRSTKNVLNIANKLIKNNTSRIEKVLWTDNEEGELPVYFSAYDETKEAEYVAGSIYNLINRGVQPNQIAVLFRLSAISRLIEEKLLSYNLPYVVSGIFKFFERAEIKNVLAYLRLTVNPKDNESLKRIINFPKRGIGNVSIEKIESLAKSNGVSMLDVVLGDYDLPKALKEKLESLKYVYTHLPDSKEGMYNFCEKLVKNAEIYGVYNKQVDEDNDRLLNISQLMQSIKSFENQNPNSELSDYLESITLQNSIEETDDANNSVSVSTIHASKGLEFDYVYIMGAEEGLFPISRAVGLDDEIEEERRLMYVAITRARKKVFITNAKSRYLYRDKIETTPSRFIEEMDLLPKRTEVDTGYSDGYGSYSKSSYNGYNSNYGGGYSRSSEYSYNNSNYNSNKTTMYNNTDSMYNYAKDTSEKVSTNLQDLMVKKISNQKNNYDGYTVGTQVLHPKFGIGTIIKNNLSGVSPDVTVDFGKFGNKTMSLSIAPLQILKKKQ
ncbi:MAG: 3'-5' exonuclease [Eubacteriales bacterium]|nr:3'-5' exonuclease [Eubacteriales bacterium]